MTGGAIRVGDPIHPFAIDELAFRDPIRPDTAQPGVEDDEEGRAVRANGRLVMNAARLDDIVTLVHRPVFVREVAFEDGKLVVVTKAGERKRVNVNSDDDKKSTRFSDADADRFVAAVVARKKELGIP